MNRKHIIFIFALLALFTFARMSYSANIVAAWLLDEGKGEEIKDSSGNDNTGQFFGKPEWTEGKNGRGIRLHGTPDHIEVPDPDHKLIPKHMTLVAWINLDNISGNHAILEQYDWAGSLGAYAWRTNNAELQLYVIWGVDAPVISGGALNAGEWMHVAATYDGQEFNTWINGEVAATGNDAQKRDLAPSDKSLSIGVRGDSKDTHWMQGVFDEIAIFDEALTKGEIQNVMKNGLSPILAISPKGKLAATWSQIKSF